MSRPPSPFSLLGKLPVELRLPIWADVMSSRQPAVLRTSRAIYEEIVHELNHVLEYTLFPEYKDPWLRLHSPRTELTFDITRRDGKKIQKRLWQLSYNNTVLTIHIMAPNQEKPGEIALLWQKAQDLVGILNRAKYYRAHIVLVFQETEGRRWKEGGTPTQSIPHPGDPRPDYLIAFLPFCRLAGVRKMEVVRVTPEGQKVAIRWRFVKYRCDFIMNGGYRNYNWDDSQYSQRPQYRDIVRAFDDLDRMVAETDFFLETALDLLPGHTAAMLRLDRFARWFTTKNPDDSPYQRRCLSTIREYPHVVNTYDPGLSGLRQRHRAFESFYYSVPGTGYCVDVRCNPKAWYTAYPNGIDRLTVQRVRLEQDRIYQRKEWVGPPGDYHEFARDIESFLLIQRNDSMANRRVHYLRFTMHWCLDCAQAGFRAGCLVCETYNEPLPYIHYCVMGDGVPADFPPPLLGCICGDDD